MCLSGECAACQERERIAHVAYLKDSKTVVEKDKKGGKKPTTWLKFRSDVKIGGAGDQADPIDISYLNLVIYPQQRK